MKQISNKLFFEQVEALIAEGQEAELRLRGNSMRPLLRDGRDTVIIAPTTDHELQPREVVLFRYQGRHILHRIRRRSGNNLLLAGDGNYRLTEQCTTADVVGRMVRIRRRSGRVIACNTWHWRLPSACWLLLPALLRRILLAILRRIGR